MTRTPVRLSLPLVLLLAGAPYARAQQFESLGTRALGMGGAFVAVADDATAVYWNPAGIATGPTFNLLLDWAEDGRGADGDSVPGTDTSAANGSAQMIAFGIPPFGASYYRLRTTSIRPGTSVAAPPGAVADSLVTHQVGATFAQTVFGDLVVGTTVKVVHGIVSSGSVSEGRVGDVLDAGANLDGRGTTTFDLDFGALWSFQSGRIGVSVRNLREAAFDAPDPAEPSLKLQRLARVGAAWTPGRHGATPPAGTTLAVDVDVNEFHDVQGDQRNVAVGAEHWLKGRRFGMRGGFRLNALETSERVGSIGASWSPGKGALLEGEWTRGTREADRSWAAALRMAF